MLIHADARALRGRKTRTETCVRIHTHIHSMDTHKYTYALQTRTNIRLSHETKLNIDTQPSLADSIIKRLFHLCDPATGVLRDIYTSVKSVKRYTKYTKYAQKTRPNLLGPVCTSNLHQEIAIDKRISFDHSITPDEKEGKKGCLVAVPWQERSKVCLAFVFFPYQSPPAQHIPAHPSAHQVSQAAIYSDSQRFTPAHSN